MARNVQLQALVSSLRSEIRDSTSVALGIDQEPMLKQTLMRIQQTLYQDYDWDFLRIKPLKTLSAGQRYYDFPTINGFTLNLERIEEVAVWYSNQPAKVTRGIGFAEYAQFNSNIDVRSDPVLNWDVVSTGISTSTGNIDQLEVWPIPASNNMSLQFIGLRNLRPLIANTDVCDLDDALIYLFAAAEILTAQKSADADNKLKLANEYYMKLKGRLKGGGSTITLGGGSDGMSRERLGTIVRIGATTNS